jgi:hypothetical protein
VIGNPQADSLIITPTAVASSHSRNCWSVITIRAG